MEPIIKIIWQWQGLERIRLFLWLIANDSLHINAYRLSKHLTTSDLCTHCKDVCAETILHALRDCPILGNFWPQMVTFDDWPEFSTIGLHSWLLSNL